MQKQIQSSLLGYLAIFVHGEKKTETIIKFGKDKTFEMLKDMLKAYFPVSFAQLSSITKFATSKSKSFFFGLFSDIMDLQ
jgi:hypothetical protein